MSEELRVTLGSFKNAGGAVDFVVLELDPQYRDE